MHKQLYLVSISHKAVGNWVIRFRPHTCATTAPKHRMPPKTKAKIMSPPDQKNVRGLI